MFYFTATITHYGYSAKASRWAKSEKEFLKLTKARFPKAVITEINYE